MYGGAASTQVPGPVPFEASAKCKCQERKPPHFVMDAYGDKYPAR